MRLHMFLRVFLDSNISVGKLGINVVCRSIAFAPVKAKIVPIN